MAELSTPSRLGGSWDGSLGCEIKGASASTLLLSWTTLSFRAPFSRVFESLGKVQGQACVFIHNAGENDSHAMRLLEDQVTVGHHCMAPGWGCVHEAGVSQVTYSMSQELKSKRVSLLWLPPLVQNGTTGNRCAIGCLSK